MDEENGSNNFLPKDFSSPKRGSTAENKVENLSLDSGPESNVLEAGFRTNVTGASYNRATMDSTQDSSLGLHNLMENSSGQVTGVGYIRPNPDDRINKNRGPNLYDHKTDLED